ncbi:MAG: tetratricopeptide repeat protein [Planctomycetota bacterium]
MSKLNKEQVLLILTLVILGTLTYSQLGDRYTHVRTPQAKGDLELDPAVPCAPVQFIENDDLFYSREGRNFFAPPRDWLPLDQLILDLPPSLTLHVVSPLPVPGPGTPFFQEFHYLPGTNGPTAAKQDDAADQEESVSADTYEETGDDVAGSEANGSRTAGKRNGMEAGVASAVDDEEADPEALFLTQYDWLRLNGHTSRIFGHILNEDKYSLLQNGNLIRFEQVATRTGKALGTHEYTRDRIDDFGFADTIINRIELALLDVRFHAGNLKSIHDKIRWCVTLRDQDERALDYAVRLGRKAIELDPLSKESYGLLADVYRIRFDYESELEVLLSAIRQRLNAPDVYVRYGKVLRRYGMDDAAMEAFRKAEQIVPAYAEALIARAGMCYDHQDYDQALGLFEEAWRSPSWKPELKMDALLGEGSCLLALNKNSEALAKAQRAVNLDEKDGAAWNLKGACSLVKGDLEGAEAAFSKAMECSPDKSAYLINHGICRFRQGKLIEAADAFQEAADLEPFDSCRAYAALGFTQECMGNEGPASSAYEQAVRVDPGNFYALYLLGRDQRRHGDAEAAIHTLKQALQSNSRMLEILCELGQACLLAGRDEDAGFYFDEYLKRSGIRDFRVLYLYGLTLLKQTRIQEALALFTETIAIDENQPEPFNGDAYTLHALSRIDECLASLGKVMRLFEADSQDPRYEYAKRWMTRIEEHRRKSQWLDSFQRKEIKNDWTLDQRAGPLISLINNQVVIKGLQRQEQPDQKTTLVRELSGKVFRIFEADVTAREGTQGRSGIFLGLYISRGMQGTLTKAEVSVAVEPNGALVYDVVDKNKSTISWERIGQARAEINTPVRLRIELVDYDEGLIRIFADGEPLLEQDLDIKSLKRCARNVTAGIFATAPGSRVVDMTADNVRIVICN